MSLKKKTEKKEKKRKKECETSFSNQRSSKKQFCSLPLCDDIQSLTLKIMNTFSKQPL
jgi:hypothetical protein